MGSILKQRLHRFNGIDYDTIYVSSNVEDATGTLPVANGGTGRTTLTSGYFLRGNDTNAITMSTAAESRDAMGLGNTTGALPVANGGTGRTTLTSGYFLRGNGTGAVTMSTAAESRNAMGLGNSTGALAVANGGTGQTTLAAARNAMGLGNTTGTLPVANGGTGQTTASGAFAAISTPQEGAAWKTAQAGMSNFYYEGANTSTYGIPYAHCIVTTIIKQAGRRGVAYAKAWPGDAANKYWISVLHDDTGSSKWSDWKPLFAPTMTSTDPGAGSALATGDVIFVYE